MSGFGEVRSALHGAPSQQGWQALCEALEQAPVEAQDALVSYAQDLLRGWPDALRVAPWRWLRALTRAGEDSARFGALLTLVREVQVGGYGVSDALAMALAQAPLQLSALTLEGALSASSATALLRAPWRAGLRVLSLRGARLDHDAMSALTQGPPWLALEALTLRGAGLDGRSLTALALASTMTRLRRLHLEGNQPGEAGARALAQARWMEQLEALGLGGGAREQLGAGIGPEGLRALSDAGLPWALTRLSLPGNAIGEEGITRWAGALVAREAIVEVLALSQNMIWPRCIAPLAQALPTTRRLTLSHNPLGQEGLRAMDHAGLSRLEALAIDGCDAGDGRAPSAGWSALLGARHLAGLKAMSARHNRLVADDMRGFERASMQLERAQLDGNALGDDGVYALTRASSMGGLKALELGGCQVGARGARCLATAPGVSAMEALGLRDNALGDGGLRALLEGGDWQRLRALDLSRCGLSDGGANFLAQQPVLGQLERLGLEGNALSAAGYEALARSVWAPERLRRVWRRRAARLDGARG